MDIQWQNGAVRITGVSFDAQLTLIDSAQCFGWRAHEGKFYTVLYGAAIALEPHADGFSLYPVLKSRARDYIHYFDLDRDYGALHERYGMHPCAARALSLLPGLRVLNQPAWDALIYFILSANNNVARIRRLAQTLAAQFGRAHDLDGLTLYELPAPEVLARVPETTLRALGFGYRAPFLVNTARKIAGGFPLDALSKMSCDEAHQLLLELPGVGDKVADCVLLFGCGHASAFPVDVWVDRLMRAWFEGLSGCKTRPALKRAACAMLGEEAGLIQQFLFHCARCDLIPLDGAEG